MMRLRLVARVALVLCKAFRPDFQGCGALTYSTYSGSGILEVSLSITSIINKKFSESQP